jgi:hypothetical protein
MRCVCPKEDNEGSECTERAVAVCDSGQDLGCGKMASALFLLLCSSFTNTECLGEVSSLIRALGRQREQLER